MTNSKVKTKTTNTVRLAMYLFNDRTLSDALSFLQDSRDHVIHKMSCVAKPQGIIEVISYDDESDNWEVSESPCDENEIIEDQLLSLIKKGIFCRTRLVTRLYFFLSSVDDLLSMQVFSHPVESPCLVLEMEKIAELDRLFRRIPICLKEYEKKRILQKIALLRKQHDDIRP